MTTGQTLLALGALIFLTMSLLNFYNVFGYSRYTVDSAQLGIDATTISTSYMEIAYGLAFDAAVLDSTVVITSPSDLRQSHTFGAPEGVNKISEFTKFDDFHGFRDTVIIPDIGTYVTDFEVYYVYPGSVQARSIGQTYAKRMDMKIWRIIPPPPEVGIDTLHMWTVMGYFSYQ
jgi:hypothetical protein